MKMRTHQFLIPLGVAISLTGAVRADSVAPPYSYTVASPGGEYIFVMLSPRPVESDAAPWIEEKAARIREIRKIYSESGLYRSDGSTNALWTVDWYSYSVVPCSDGVHAVRPGRWPSTSRQEALSFFANGELLKSYRIDQLVDFPMLMPHSVSHFMWRASASLDDQNRSYHLRTLHGEIYRFDIRTGRITSSLRAPRWILAALVVGSLALFWQRRRKRRMAIGIGTPLE